jgi:hypothetical protein
LVQARGQAACGAALKGAERITVEDVADSQVFFGTPALEVILDAGARAVQSTPLFYDAGRILRMLSTHYRHPGVSERGYGGLGPMWFAGA